MYLCVTVVRVRVDVKNIFQILALMFILLT